MLYVHAGEPCAGKDGGLEFPDLFSALFVWADEGHVGCWRMGQGFDEFETKRSSGDGNPEIPLLTLFVMLNLLADDRSTISRTVAPVEVNDARAQRGLPLIPPMWTVSRGDLVELCSTSGGPKQPPGKRRADKGGLERRTYAARTSCSASPHSRRGHRRRLRSGRTLLVRSAQIGEALRHMTRPRSFYEVENATGQ